MGPPERPKKDKDMDVSDLQDVVNASGIDLREEENYMASTYRWRGDGSSQSTSFGSYNTSPNNSFGVWQQASFGSYPAFQGAGPFSQPPVPQKTVEELIEERHRQSARRLAELQEKHVRDAFLNLEFVRNKFHKLAAASNVRFTADGRMTQSDRPKVFGTYLAGADGIGIVQARSQSAIVETSKLADMLSLISLGAEEHLRSILEDAVSIARNRRSTSEGVVPLDFVDIADGPSKPITATLVIPPKPITSSVWEGVVVPESAISPFTVVPPALPTDSRIPSIVVTDTESSQDTVLIDGPPADLPNGETTSASAPELQQPNLPPTPPTSEPKDTIAFASPYPPLLRTLGTTDLAAEKARLEARKRRRAEREARDKERQSSLSAGAGAAGGEPTASPSSADPTSAGTPGTPAAASEPKPDVAPLKMSKKERERLAKANQTSEAASRIASNATANLALGGMGKKYSWLTAASSAAVTTPAFGAGAGMGARNVAAGGGGAGAGGAPGKGAPARVESEEEKSLKARGEYKRVGAAWKESGAGGEGVQVRDVVAVLERDAGFGDVGAERVVARALVRLRDESVERPVRKQSVGGAAGVAALNGAMALGANGAR